MNLKYRFTYCLFVWTFEKGILEWVTYVSGISRMLGSGRLLSALCAVCGEEVRLIQRGYNMMLIWAEAESCSGWCPPLSLCFSFILIYGALSLFFFWWERIICISECIWPEEWRRVVSSKLAQAFKNRAHSVFVCMSSLYMRLTCWGKPVLYIQIV